MSELIIDVWQNIIQYVDKIKSISLVNKDIRKMLFQYKSIYLLIYEMKYNEFIELIKKYNPKNIIIDWNKFIDKPFDYIEIIIETNYKRIDRKTTSRLHNGIIRNIF